MFAEEFAAIGHPSDDSAMSLLRYPFGLFGSSLCLVAALAGATGCRGIDAEVEYPSDLPSPNEHLLSPENEKDASVSLGAFKFSPSMCQGIDTGTEVQKLTPDDLAKFLERQGMKVEPKQARPDLFWFDFPNGRDGDNGQKGYVRFRLAVLNSAPLAAKDLHDSVLDHGPGWWGVHRSNLALLAPKAGLDEAVAFAVKYKLPCWGIFTYAGRDDAYVVPGPYAEP